VSRLLKKNRHYLRCGVGILGALGRSRDGNVDTNATTGISAGHFDA
jgi:hypothetical protein